MIGKNIESACKSWHYRTAVRLEMAAEVAAGQALALPAGSPEYLAKIAEFIKAEAAVEDHFTRFADLLA